MSVNAGNTSSEEDPDVSEDESTLTATIGRANSTLVPEAVTLTSGNSGGPRVALGSSMAGDGAVVQQPAVASWLAAMAVPGGSTGPGCSDQLDHIGPDLRVPQEPGGDPEERCGGQEEEGLGGRYR